MVLTAIAKDRPGLVDALADVIAAAGGNWLESSMARLGGEFAGIVSFEVPEDRAATLESALAALSGEGIAVTLRTGAPEAEDKGRKIRLDLVCQDQPGILRAVTRVIAAEGISIETLETLVGPGSMSGEMLFRASADLRLPAGASVTRLHEAIQSIAADLMADIDMNEEDD
ncbi:glycine cleavage system protein R [Pannonibacter tanglangensis]|nr:ACT domain-containing protein [Pannonibacter sp. XCT-53]